MRILRKRVGGTSHHTTTTTKDIIYLDYNATSKPYECVIEVVCDVLRNFYGNPSSKSCLLGIHARETLENCRQQICQLLHIPHPMSQLIFTSCATESNNFILRGVVSHRRKQIDLPHVISTNFEHPSIKSTLDDMVAHDLCSVTLFKVKETSGVIDIAKLKRAIVPNKTVLVAIILANNEIGVVQQDREIVDAVKSVDKKVHIHFDLTQMVGRYDLDFVKMGMDSASFSGHKFGALPGIGGAYVKDRNKIDSFLTGGLQEGCKRAGTENIAGIAAMATALSHSMDHLETNRKKIEGNRDHLQTLFVKAFPKHSKHKCTINGLPPQSTSDKRPTYRKRLYNTLSITFDFIDNQRVLRKLCQKGVCVNVGPACSKQTGAKSLRAIGLTPQQESGTLRISLGPEISRSDINRAFEIIREIIEQEIPSNQLRPAQSNTTPRRRSTTTTR